MIFTGHDPGKGGAIASIDESKRVLALDDVPLDFHGEVDGIAFAALFHVGSVVCIEENHSRSHADKQGRRVVPASDYAFGFVSGAAWGICVAKGIAPMMVSPQTWKRAITMGMPASDTKDASVRMAKALFPSAQAMLYGSRGGALDGRAEALLIAEYARRLWKLSARPRATSVVSVAPAVQVVEPRCVHRKAG
jgi:hypothetical protein